MAADDAVVLSDARAIRALAHPARLLATERLFASAGTALTATELAELAGVTPSAMSYHLRLLERYGILRRAEAGADERQRPWRAAGSELVVRSTGDSGPGGRAAVDLLVGQLLDRVARSLGELSARADREPEEWRVGGLFPETAYLTAEETARMRDEVSEVVTRWSRHRPAPEPGTRRVGITVALVPEAEPPSS